MAWKGVNTPSTNYAICKHVNMALPDLLRSLNLLGWGGVGMFFGQALWGAQTTGNLMPSYQLHSAEPCGMSSMSISTLPSRVHTFRCLLEQNDPTVSLNKLPANCAICTLAMPTDEQVGSEGCRLFGYADFYTSLTNLTLVKCLFMFFITLFSLLCIWATIYHFAYLWAECHTRSCHVSASIAFASSVNFNSCNCVIYCIAEAQAKSSLPHPHPPTPTYPPHPQSPEQPYGFTRELACIELHVFHKLNQWRPECESTVHYCVWANVFIADLLHNLGKVFKIQHIDAL